MLVIDQRLADKDPSNTQLQSDLAVDHDKVGDVVKAQGDLAGALAAYRENLAIRQALAQKNPSNVQSQTDIVASFYKLASSGDDPQANLTEALAILKRLEAADTLPPDKKGWIVTIETALAKAGD
jgi:hypothetical protein